MRDTKRECTVCGESPYPLLFSAVSPREIERVRKKQNKKTTQTSYDLGLKKFVLMFNRRIRTRQKPGTRARCRPARGWRGSSCQSRWRQKRRSLTSDPTILNIVKGYKIEFESPPIQLNTPVCLIKDNEFLTCKKEVQRLLKIGAIKKCSPVNGQFLSSYFLHPKSDGSVRFVLNLKKPNAYIHSNHFKMEDFRTACNLLSNGEFMGKLDLKDAYFAVSIAKESRKYLRFSFDNSLYEFTSLPFGLNVAPLVFTKIMKVPITSLREKGFKSVIYLDDLLCLGRTLHECRVNLRESEKLLTALGFTIHIRKSSLVPSLTCTFLGFTLNSVEMTLGLPVEKRDKMQKLIDQFLTTKSCTIGGFASLLGSLISIFPAIEYGWLYTKRLEQLKIEALITSNNNFNSKMTIPSEAREDLHWWRSHVTSDVKKLQRTVYPHEIYSDASKTGWGAFHHGDRAKGMWSFEEAKLHINELELLAALFALKCFASNLSNVKIIMRVDNTTAMAYINKMGGTHSKRLFDVAKQIWQWCEEREIKLRASYIPSKENVEADTLSRQVNPEIESELNSNAFHEIINMFGAPEIDLFASRLNAKVQRYVSWHKDPEAFSIDAFTLNWNGLFFYAFPPFALILRLLRKMINDRAKGIVVVPHWPSQPWFPLFKSLLFSDTITFKPSDYLLKSYFWNVKHPLAGQLSLTAGILSGKALRRDGKLPSQLPG